MNETLTCSFGQAFFPLGKNVAAMAEQSGLLGKARGKPLEL
jgi:hypothetical protein